MTRHGLRTRNPVNMAAPATVTLACEFETAEKAATQRLRQART